jgi:hypothetical protein
MRLESWDPDLQTLFSRIESGDLSLQPDFQRGEVWGNVKKKRLIDTILRQWHIPPIHVVVDPETAKLEVLDGQQRLAAIRDFMRDEFSIDGSCKPLDDGILQLDGLLFSELPADFRRRFTHYSLRTIRVSDFSPEEPGELFFRLNQPTSLTSAEQRNAFYGIARKQVKSLVSSFEEFGINDSLLGFKNSRMAYDDVIARALYTLHVGTLRKKVTASTITDIYRSNERFSDKSVDRLMSALEVFGEAASRKQSGKFNKATFYSWLLFICRLSRRASSFDISALGDFLVSFEYSRSIVGGNERSSVYSIAYAWLLEDRGVWEQLFLIFNDRAASRVADVSSVLLRDLIMWLSAVAHSDLLEEKRVKYEGDINETMEGFLNSLSSKPEGYIELTLEEFLAQSDWGQAV